MNKITLSVFAVLLFTGFSFGQSKQPVNKKNSQLNSSPLSTRVSNLSDPYGVQLNEENQRFLNENGVVRCLSEEMNKQYRLNNPNRKSVEEFEEWIAPLVEEHKARVAEQKANGTFRMAVVNIPIIFHVISGGAADPANLDAFYVDEQIRQLNLDFGNLAGGASGPWSSVAADAQIVFVPATVDPSGNPLPEPGINRVFDYPGTLSTADFDNTIKPATSWDRTKYCNNWTGNLGGGLLGYAQFPDGSTLPGMPGSGGAPNTDGVVNLYSSIGSVDNPNPDGGVYAAGRTLTHEIGHWIGLRHIWGDGNCSVDDFCADTPNQGASSGGCPNTNDTCGDPDRDMVENFMDYSFDTCMNLFTADQVARMAVVLANSPGRTELPNSTAGAAAPSVTFVNATQTASEGTDCSFTDITIDLAIGAFAPTQNAVATLSVNGGTATSSDDYTLLTNTVTFAQGATANQTATLRIYNDGFVEGDETVDLTFSLNANGGDAEVGNNNMTITINDDDSNITPQITTNVFTSTSDDLTGWGIIDVDGGETWGVFTGGINIPGVIEPDFFGSQALDNDNGTPNPNDDIETTDDILISPEFTFPASATSISIEHALLSFNSLQNYELYFSNTSNTSGEILAGTLLASGNATLNNGSNTLETINLTGPQVTALAGQTGSLSLRHLMPTNDNGYLLWDTITVTAVIDTFIQTAVNENLAGEYNVPLSESGTVNARNTTDNFVMASITNNNTFDYDCVTVAVSRSGNGTQAFNGSTGNNLVMDKTFTITPTNTTTTGDTTIDFYVTAAEMTGFTSGTGLTNNDLFAYREGSNDVIALTTTAFGSDFRLSGDFTGLDGIYYIGAEGAFKTTVSPRVFLSGPAFSGGLMADGLRSGGYIPTTSPYADSKTCAASVFNVTGNNAIVDWVWVELRDANTNTTISASTSALLQRDGDVVDVDGTSSLTIVATSKDYYIVVNHRNHLGAMSNAVITLSMTPTVVDFTSGLTTFGTNAQKDMGTGTMGLWAGDTSGNGQVRFLGPGNDTNSLKTTITSDLSNTSGSLSFPVNGYNNADINLNGQARFLGPGNDTNSLKNAILANPNNTGASLSFPITQQLP